MVHHRPRQCDNYEPRYSESQQTPCGPALVQLQTTTVVHTTIKLFKQTNVNETKIVFTYTYVFTYVVKIVYTYTYVWYDASLALRCNLLRYVRSQFQGVLRGHHPSR